jgi:predicted glycogen debranching enzyme
MRITKEELSDFEHSSKLEWLITNGIGGYASSTVLGLNTRKYHGLLVAALGETSDRCVTLSKLNETVEYNGKSYSLSTNQCNNFVEQGYTRQEAFERDFLPEFEYRLADIIVRKTIAMKYGENKIGIVYKIKTERSGIRFTVQPLINFRSFHEVRNCYSLNCTVNENAVNVELNSHGTRLHLIASDGFFEKYERTFYRNMFYEIEKERGLEAYEDHFMPGAYVIDVPENTERVIEFVAEVNDEGHFLEKANASEIIRGEIVRLEKLCRMANARNEVDRELTIAADNFIVKRGKRKTIIAGYPWFGDWGRDTFIAFEGILLKTNRYKDAKEILFSFVPYVKNGLIPNLIDENGGSAYNTVDASLWFIDAIYKYYKYTRDMDTISQLYDTIKEIIDAYKNGTDYGIKMDEKDGLIFAGNKDTQLTWMDAKVGDVVPTPRYGKAVEINALWYNALKIFEEFSRDLEKDYDTNLSKMVKESFTKFNCEKGLLDVIEPESKQIRPNQIIPIGLDYSPVEPDKAKEIIDVVEDYLYTDKGLKTLASDDPQYQPYYEGGVYTRDMSYHQGTVWPWLLQFYFTASRRYKGVYRSLESVEKMLRDDCVGSIAEIYDAEEPRKAKGAYAQAWSVAMANLNS